MTFHHIAARIRSRSAWDDEWIDDLFLHLPDDLLHAFACNCARRTLEREEKRGRVANIQVWELLVAKRKFARGEANDKELDAAFERAHGAVGYKGMHIAKASPLEAAMDAAFEAANDDPFEAAKGAAFAAARSAGVDAKDATGRAERTWQLNHLADLCELWGNYGEGALRAHDAAIPDRGR